MDHYVRSLPGRLHIYKGGTQEKYMLHGGMVFTDRASRYVSTGHQVNLSYGESMKSKLKREIYATNCGLLVQAYHTENRNFTCKKFMEMIIGQGQNIRFGGVGATHQNRVSENSIKTITFRDHTMMIHSDMRSLKE